jgi:hypothetical protein
MGRYISAWLLVGLVCSLAAAVFVATALQSAPRSSRPLASLVIGQGPQRVTLPGRALSCASAPPAGAVADCSIALEWRVLRVVAFGTASGALTGCAAEFSGQTRACRVLFIYAPNPTPSVVIDNGLGLGPAYVDALRQQYALAQYSEADWLRITLLLSLALGLVGLGIFWAQVRPQTWPARAAVAGSSVLLTGVLAVALQIGLLALGYID